MLHHHKQLKLDYLQTKIATDRMHCKFKSSGQKKKREKKKKKVKNKRISRHQVTMLMPFTKKNLIQKHLKLNITWHVT